jgi:hypothetical protein
MHGRRQARHRPGRPPGLDLPRPGAPMSTASAGPPIVADCSLPSGPAVDDARSLLDLPPELRAMVQAPLGPRTRHSLRLACSTTRAEVDAAVSQAGIDSPDELAAVLKRFPNLASLRIGSHDQPRAAVWDAPRLAHDHPHLRNLFLHATGGPPAVIDLTFLARLPGLRCLMLDVGKSVGPAWLSHVAALASLEELVSRQWPVASGRDTAMIATLTTLKTLAIQCRNMNAAGMTDLGRLPNLASLSLSGSGVLCEAALQAIAAMPHLKEISLAGHWRIEAADPARMDGMQALQRLHLQSFSPLIDARFSALRHLPNLADISLVDCRLDIAGAVGIASLPQLRHLRLSNCRGPLPAIRAALATNEQLETFAMINPAVPPGPGLDFLAQCKGLRTLALTHNRQLGDDCLSEFLATPRAALDTVSLSGCTGITDAGLARLSTLKNLVELEADDSNAGPVTAKACEGHPTLRTVSFSHCTKIDDNALASLAKIPALEKLSLALNFKITDAGLAHLEALPNLKRLDLLFCPGVSAAGVRRLQARLPELQIVGDE